MKYLFAGLKVCALVVFLMCAAAGAQAATLDSNEDSATLTTACAMRIVR